VLKRQYRVGYQNKIFIHFTFNHHSTGQSLPLLWNVLRGEMRFTGLRALSPEEAKQLTRTREKIRFNAYPGIFTLYELHQRLGIHYKTEAEDERTYLKNNRFTYNISLILRSLLSLLYIPSATLPPPKPIIEIFRIPISNMTLQDALEQIMLCVKADRKTLFSFVNADCLNIAYHHWDYRQALKKSAHIFADGSGIRIASKMLKEQLLGNVNGTDLFPQLCERLADTPFSIYLLGAKPQVAQHAALLMQQRYSGLKIAGTHDGYFTIQETSQLIEKINQSGASVLLVGMGAPRQEIWLAQHRAQLNPAVCIGVGGLFDFYSGHISRAPLWVREIGLEWVWRLSQEPSRLWKRYLIGNPLFLYRVWKQVRQQLQVQSMISYYQVSRLSVLSGLVLDIKLRVIMQYIRANLSLKRLFDITVSSVLLLLCAPVFLITALCIRLNSKGDILFSQTRVGKNGAHFSMWKFRSMYIDAEECKVQLMQQNEMKGGVLFKMKQDPRVTPVGKIIRKFSIDELPQLWNVLHGDMSLVGPRPPLPSEVEQYTPHDLQRLKVKPGLTCTWQVSGRSEIPFPQQVEMDLEYIATQSFKRDIILLLKTIPAVIKAKGAY
jgi:exopolysaccharide biosynthesis WecB/TagA/CpsF family protein